MKVINLLWSEFSYKIDSYSWQEECYSLLHTSPFTTTQKTRYSKKNYNIETKVHTSQLLAKCPHFHYLQKTAFIFNPATLECTLPIVPIIISYFKHSLCWMFILISLSHALICLTKLLTVSLKYCTSPSLKTRLFFVLQSHFYTNQVC